MNDIGSCVIEPPDSFNLRIQLGWVAKTGSRFGKPVQFLAKGSPRSRLQFQSNYVIHDGAFEAREGVQIGASQHVSMLSQTRQVVKVDALVYRIHTPYLVALPPSRKFSLNRLDAVIPPTHMAVC